MNFSLPGTIRMPHCQKPHGSDCASSEMGSRQKATSLPPRPWQPRCGIPQGNKGYSIAPLPLPPHCHLTAMAATHLTAATGGPPIKGPQGGSGRFRGSKRERERDEEHTPHGRHHHRRSSGATALRLPQR
jgi:hypothetical protein